MNTNHWSRKLKAIGACKDAVKWAKEQPSFAQAWQTCERGDWMLWLAGKMHDKPEWPTRQQLVLAACDCAELSLKYVPKGEDRPRVAIETARAWAKGKATIDEVAAAAAAGAAADADAYAAAAARLSTLSQCAVLVRKALTVPEVL